MTRPTTSAVDYHRATSYRRNHLTPHHLDWAHQPVAVKPYPKIDRVRLDSGDKLPEIDYFELLPRMQRSDNRRPGPMTVKEIATAFRLTHAVTARSMHSGQPFYYRSVASAGALYPFELYLAARHIDGLGPGVYHYDLFDFCLNTLRRGVAPDLPPVERSVDATFYITGIYFRSAWKYRDRAYRYVLLDAGHLLENLRLALGALNRAFSIHLDFDDDRAATLLGLDPDREVCLACVHLYADPAQEKQVQDRGDKPLAANLRRASMVSDQEVVYDKILEVHRAGRVGGNRSPDPLGVTDQTVGQPGAWIDLKPSDYPDPLEYARLLWQRRSRRNFISAPVSLDAFSTFMDLMVHSSGNASGMPPVCPAALTTGLLVGQNMPVGPGFYLLDARAKRLGRILDGDITEPMAGACLDQMWLKHAGLHVLFITNVAALERAWGARGYRYAMIEAGRLGQQAYLAATALGWGACGIGAIYDREAADLLDLAPDRSLLYLVGAGPVKSR